MKTVVVDASVAAKWFLPEPGADRARGVLDGRHRLIAPDLLWVEVASVVRKNVVRNLLSQSDAEEIVRDCAGFPVEVFESITLLTGALRIASEAGRSVYDALYVSLAVREKATLVTSDERLVNALGGTPYGKRVALLDAFV